MDDGDALSEFLAQHPPIADNASVSPGAILSGWRIVAFLGRGGSAEVYRAVNDALAIQGAVKVLVRGEPSHIERFNREASLLAKLNHTAFPRFFGHGEVDGRPYMIMELLEPMELPRKDKPVAKFLVSVAEGVKALHALDIVHRDLKPQNIMRRANGSPVIIDLGLAKKLEAVPNIPAPSTLSIVDGKRVGLGTPRYAAPEQFSGGEISPAADIHALGMLADECFNGKAPPCWARIIRRATSSIPAMRYSDTNGFIHAIRHRHWLRNTLLSCVAFGILAAAVAISFFDPVEADEPSVAVDDAQPVVETEAPVVAENPELLAWRGLTESMTTNIVELGEVVSETLTTNRFGYVTWTDRVYRNVTNEIDLALVRLNSVTNRFESPIQLDAGREYWIVGPGVLDAELLAPTGTMVRLENCVFINRTRTPVDVSKINYELKSGVYMNFPELDEPATKAIVREYINDHNSNANKVRFRGPNSLTELREEEERERWYMIRRDMGYPY